MADDDDMNHHDHEVHGFGISLPSFLVDGITGARDARAMNAQASETEVFHLLDGLNADQLMTLRRMLCIDNDSASNNYFDGQIVTLLRVVHKIDIASGKRFDDALDELGLTPPPAPTAG